jgi:hypothetical protein
MRPRACTHITTTAGELDQLASALAELIPPTLTHEKRGAEAPP